MDLEINNETIKSEINTKNLLKITKIDSKKFEKNYYILDIFIFN